MSEIIENETASVHGLPRLRARLRHPHPAGRHAVHQPVAAPGGEAMSAADRPVRRPGPRARRRHAILTGVGARCSPPWRLCAGAVASSAQANQLERAMWSRSSRPRSGPQYLIPGLIDTLKAAAISIVLAGIFGLVFGIGRLSHAGADPLGLRRRRGVLPRGPGAADDDLRLRRATPATTCSAADVNPLAAVVTGLTLYNGVGRRRAGALRRLLACPKGQAEAGLSIGLTRGQTLRSIQLPQALTAMLPALVGQLVVILKDTALGYDHHLPASCSQGQDARHGVREHGPRLHRGRGHVHRHQLRADRAGRSRRAAAEPPRAARRCTPRRRRRLRHQAQVEARAGAGLRSAADAGLDAPLARTRRRARYRCGPGPLVCGSPGWTRTNNLPVNSRLLCQLSYRGMVISAGPRWRCATIAKQPPGSENGAAGASRGWQIAVGAGPEDGFPPLRPALGASAEADLLLEVVQRRGGLLAHARVVVAHAAAQHDLLHEPAAGEVLPDHGPRACAAPRGRRAGRAPRWPEPARAAVSGSSVGSPEEPLRRPLAVDPGDGEQGCLVRTRYPASTRCHGRSSATSPAGRHGIQAVVAGHDGGAAGRRREPRTAACSPRPSVERVASGLRQLLRAVPTRDQAISWPARGGWPARAGGSAGPS